MKEFTIDELKEQIRKLEMTNKILAENSNKNQMAIDLLVVAGHLSEDKLNQARELAQAI